jgi:hypothetical protein
VKLINVGGTDLWSIVGGAETTPPTEEEELRKWKI